MGDLTCLHGRTCHRCGELGNGLDQNPLWRWVGLVMIALFELKDDLLYRQTTFFAGPFEAPDWRAQWVERLPGSDVPTRADRTACFCGRLSVGHFADSFGCGCSQN